MNRIITYIIAGVMGVLFLGVGGWFIFFRTPDVGVESTNQTFPTTASQSTVPVTSEQTSENNPQQTPNQSLDQTKKIFKVAEGPVASAVLIQTGSPTSTIARYIMADTGRVFEIPLDSAGAVAKVVSNTTIPGLVRALWAEGGEAVLGQYFDSNTLKTIYLGFPKNTSSSTLSRAIKIQFLPDDISDLAVSPDGASVAYIRKSSGSVSGYIARADGTGSKKLFSLPLSQALLSWPSQNILLIQSPAAAGVAGIAFSIDVKSSVVSPLLYADGLTATADRAFSRVIYQTTTGSSRSTYIHDVRSGADRSISFDPFPENCSWSNVASTSLIMYCFLPLQYVLPSYLDLWHLGVFAASDSIFAFNTATLRSTILVSPGSEDGGSEATISSIIISPDDKYLLYVTKGGRELFGARIQLPQ